MCKQAAGQTIFCVFFPLYIDSIPGDLFISLNHFTRGFVMQYSANYPQATLCIIRYGALELYHWSQVEYLCLIHTPCPFETHEKRS